MLARRAARSASRRFFVARDCHPQTIAVVRTRAEPLGIEVVLADDVAQAGEGFGALLQYPASTGTVADLRGRVQALQAAGTVVAVATDLLALTLLEPPGRLGRRHRRRQRAALRRAAGLRRSARRLPRVPRRLQALDAGPAGRRVGRRPGRSGAAPGTADARAAHPPREGHLQHLHRPGAARGDRRHVRGLSRPRRPAPHRAAGAPPDGRAGGGPARRRLRVSTTAFFDTLRVPVADAAAVHAAARARGINLRDLGPRRGRDLARRDHRARRRRSAAGTSSASRASVRGARRHGRRRAAGGAAPAPGFPDASGVPPPPFAKRRCCATCAR